MIDEWITPNLHISSMKCDLVFRKKDKILSFVETWKDLNVTQSETIHGIINTTYSLSFIETIYSNLKAQNGKVGVRGEEEKGKKNKKKGRGTLRHFKNVGDEEVARVGA